MKIAKADLLPLATNLQGEYGSFHELEEACEAWEASVNARMHRVTRRAPAAMLLEERGRLHTIPEAVFVHAVGEERVVTNHYRDAPPPELQREHEPVPGPFDVATDAHVRLG